MIYLIWGDYKSASQKASSVVASLSNKQPDAEIKRYNSDNFRMEEMGLLSGSQGLFFKKTIVLLSRIIENFEEETEAILELASSSDNVFVFVEDKVSSKNLKLFEKKADKIQELKKAEAKGQTPFNVFSLTDAVAKRDKKNAWIIFRKSLAFGSVEEVYGIIWWQMKTLLIANKCSSQKESGLKPFVFNKAKNILKSYKWNDLEKKCQDLIFGYHLSRRGGAGLENFIEKWILSL